MHVDEDQLCLVALGEDVPDVDVAHLDQCPVCSSRVAELRRVVAVGRSVTPDDILLTPPEGLWVSIRDEARASGRRSTPWLLAAAAAIVGVAVGAGASLALTRGEAPVQALAQAALSPVDASGVSGTATLQSVDGVSRLVVSLPSLPPLSDGYYEVWMATPDTATMVAIGSINPGEEATLVLPASMNTASFPVVDISVEHFDGQTGHSAISVARGSLGA